jgi:hypothetical protein
MFGVVENRRFREAKHDQTTYRHLGKLLGTYTLSSSAMSDGIPRSSKPPSPRELVILV